MEFARVEGLEALFKALAALEKKVAKKIVRDAVGEASKILLASAKAKCKESADTGTLWKSLGRRVKTYRHTGALVFIVGPRTGMKRTVARPGGRQVVRNPTKYAHLVEFGTRRSRARPFMRPAWHSSRRQLDALIRTRILEGIEREAGKA